MARTVARQRVKHTTMAGSASRSPLARSRPQGFGPVHQQQDPQAASQHQNSSQSVARQSLSPGFNLGSIAIEPPNVSTRQSEAQSTLPASGSRQAVAQAMSLSPRQLGLPAISREDVGSWGGLRAQLLIGAGAGLMGTHLQMQPLIAPAVEEEGSLGSSSPQGAPSRSPEASPQTQSQSPQSRQAAGEPAQAVEQDVPSTSGAGAISGPTSGGSTAGSGPSTAGSGPSTRGRSGSQGAEQDPNFQAVIEQADQVAQDRKTHDPAEMESSEAQEAAASPEPELEGQAQDRHVGLMDQQEPGSFNAEAFKVALLERIASITPQSEDEASEFKRNNRIDSVREEMSDQLTQEQQQAAGPIAEGVEQAPSREGITPRSPTPMETPDPGSAPPDLEAERAMPEPRSEAEVSDPLKANSQELDHQMTEADITDEQLEGSNEPQFQAALTAKQEAQTHAVEAPASFQAQEETLLDQARTQAQATGQAGMEGIQGDREQLLSQVGTTQEQTTGRDEQERSRIGQDINGIYEQTKTDVEGILSGLDGEVSGLFDGGAARAKQQFEDHVDRLMSDYKRERYRGVGGLFNRVGDAFTGLPDEVNQFFVDGRQLFIDEMDGVLTQISTLVAQRLAEAKQRIAQGRQQIQAYVTSLPESLQQIGQEAAQEIQDQFDQLEQSVDDKQNQLVDDLSQQYSDTLQQVDTRIEEMQSENRGLIDKAKDLVGGAITTILEIKNMLMEALSSAAGVIGSIIRDPIGFLSNLISGVKQGLQSFIGNVGQHLQTGLVGWLTGAMGSVGLQLPEDLFSLKGIFSLVTQILGLTWQTVRGIATQMFGEPVVAAMETGMEVFQILRTDGLPGVWEHLQDQFTDLRETVMDQIRQMVISEVIEAGITWIMGLLTPAGAFIRAARAIYDIVMFFMNRASQVAELIQAITQSVQAIAQGSVGAAAQYIETALARSLPVAIGFLASLVGIGDLAQRVQRIVSALRQRIEEAIRSLMRRLRRLAGDLLRRLGLDRNGDRRQEGDETEAREGQAGDGQVGEEIRFTANENNHRLWLNDQGTPMVASRSQPVQDQLQQWQSRLNDLPEEHKSRARPLLTTAQQQTETTEREGQEAAREMREAERGSQDQANANEADQADREAEQAQRGLADTLKPLFEIFGEETLAPEERKEGAKQRFISLMQARETMSPREIEETLVVLKDEFQLSAARMEGSGEQAKVAFYASPALFLPLTLVKGAPAAAIDGQQTGAAAAARPSVQSGDYIKATSYDGPHPTPGHQVVTQLDARFQNQPYQLVPVALPAGPPNKKQKTGGGVAAPPAPPAPIPIPVGPANPQNFPLRTKTNGNTYLRAGQVEAKSSVTRGPGRSGTGETLFGHFGVDEENILTGKVSTQYNGGHLIGDQLMDSHQAFNLYEDWNLAPQIRGFNSPLYTSSVENVATKAINAGATIQYSVTVQYPGNSYQIKPSDLVKNLLPTTDPYRQKVLQAIGLNGGLDGNLTLTRRTPGSWIAEARVVVGGKTMDSGNITPRPNIAFTNNPTTVQPGVNYQPMGAEEGRYSLEIDTGAGIGPMAGPPPLKYTGATVVRETVRQQTFG